MRTRALLVLSLVYAAGCAAGPSADAGVSAEPGRPLSTLTEAELGRFLVGKAVFERLIVPDEGLGPLFNADRCSSCHDEPVTGGAGALLVTKATRAEAASCDLLESSGGDNIQQRATPLLAARGVTGESIPERANAISRMTAPPLFGLGLIDAIAEAELLAREDPEDANGDGVSGRVGRTADGQVGRFGRKAEIATLVDFIDTALRFEVGLTTPMHPVEALPNGQPLPQGVDPMPEPEIDQNGVELLGDFLRFLAAPARETLSASAADSISRGGSLFESVGCVACHQSALTTARNTSAGLDRKRVPLYSDLLLHDLGSELAGVCGASASTTEWRTAPLWGLRLRSSLMHDGRARSARDAILLHGGEAQQARDAFTALSASEQSLLLRFLSSL